MFKSPRRVALVVLLSLALAAVVAVGYVISDRCPNDPTRCAQAANTKWISDDDYVPSPDLVWTTVDGVDFFGVQYPDPEDYDTITALGADTILIDFGIGSEPERWTAQLDEAEAAGLNVVAWLWPEGWQIDEDTDQWVFDDRAVTFLETVEGHPALFAVYGTHEAYWNGCYDCGQTTAQLQDLYRRIKEYADVPVYSSFGEFHFWAEMGSETAFADGVCDYCDSWHYPVKAEGVYDLDGYRTKLELELSVFRELAPNSKFVWVLQGFGSERWGKELPSADQLREIAAIAAEADIDGVWWYPWDFDSSEYESVLGDAPELQEVIAESAPLFGRHRSE